MMLFAYTEHSFASTGKNIRLPIMEVFIHSAVGNLAWYNNLCNWLLINSVLLMPFLAKTVILDRQVSSVKIIKKLETKIPEHGLEVSIKTSHSREDDKLGRKDDTTVNKKTDMEAATLKETEAISENCDGILEFFQEFMEKSPKVVTV